MAQYYPYPQGGCSGTPSLSQPQPFVRSDQAAMYQPSPYEHYGAAPRFGQTLATPAHGKGKSQVAMIVVSVLLPWMFFVAVFSSFAFYPHYRYPQLLTHFTLLLAASMGMAVALAAVSFKSAAPARRGMAAWSLLIPASMLVAVTLGAVLGNETYLEVMRPVYDIIHLNEYDGINPSTTRGNQVMDGGLLSFVAGSHIDVSRAMSFQDLNTFCVAPIVSEDTQTTGSYDFWAVGRDCCSGENGDFGSCAPDMDDPNALTAIRVVEDSDMRMYRLAVEQAEGTFNIVATHPVFYKWEKCTSCELERLQKTGYQRYFRGVVVYLGVQGAIVWLASAAIAKM